MPAELQEQWQRHRQETDRLKNSLRQLNAKIEEAKRKKNLLIAKQKRAQAQKRIQDTIAGLEDRGAFRAFDRMSEEIEASERRAIAAAEVDDELGGDTLEKEFAGLEAEGTGTSRPDSRPSSRRWDCCRPATTPPRGRSAPAKRT